MVTFPAAAWRSLGDRENSRASMETAAAVAEGSVPAEVAVAGVAADEAGLAVVRPPPPPQAPRATAAIMPRAAMVAGLVVMLMVVPPCWSMTAACTGLGKGVSEGTQSTWRALNIPNMPSGPSAWERMWQWNAHVPGLSASTMASHRSKGAMVSVSHRNGWGSGYPSRANTSYVSPWR